ncbi:Rho GTPase-activating protein 8 [Bulinus truncatus]|nr:Rho GTPase-activating protein 8 [Bulinus truncatus]
MSPFNNDQPDLGCMTLCDVWYLKNISGDEGEDLETSKQLTEVQRILQDELPEDNYIILKFVFQFLQQVVSKSGINHMTAENVATVFGPNIAWPKGQASLATVEQAVKFALILLQHFDEVSVR